MYYVVYLANMSLRPQVKKKKTIIRDTVICRVFCPFTTDFSLVTFEHKNIIDQVRTN